MQKACQIPKPGKSRSSKKYVLFLGQPKAKFVSRKQKNPKLIETDILKKNKKMVNGEWGQGEGESGRQGDGETNSDKRIERNNRSI